MRMRQLELSWVVSANQEYNQTKSLILLVKDLDQW